MNSLQNFANFVECYHSSKTGVWDSSVGHVDIWLNGGIPPTLTKKPHQSAMDFYAATILDNCEYLAWKCGSPNWKAFPYAERNKRDTCGYGSKGTGWKIGEYAAKDKIPHGDYLVFFTKDYDYCLDKNCQKTGKMCKGWVGDPQSQVPANDI